MTSFITSSIMDVICIDYYILKLMCSVTELKQTKNGGHFSIPSACFVKTEFLCRLRSKAAHRDHFVRRLSVRVSVR